MSATISVSPQNSFAESGNSPPQFTDCSRQEDMLHIHGRLHDVWLTTRGASTDSREAGIISSELWKRIINDKGSQKVAKYEMPASHPYCTQKKTYSMWLPKAQVVPTKFPADEVFHDLSVITPPFVFAPDNYFHADDSEHCYCCDCVKDRSERKPRDKKQRRDLLVAIASFGFICPLLDDFGQTVACDDLQYIQKRLSDMLTELFPPETESCSETSQQAIDRGVQVGQLYLPNYAQILG